jgi:CRISPR-associated endonuclease/helicase Cas3
MMPLDARLIAVGGDRSDDSSEESRLAPSIAKDEAANSFLRSSNKNWEALRIVAIRQAGCSMNDSANSWLYGALRLAPGATPFPWQEELLKRFAGAAMPRAIDVPTGLGKTSVVAIWLVARALGAPIPRRLVYVVDRRAVVDQATAVAEGLRAFVDATPSLKNALGLEERSLPISTLRGQYIDNRDWLEDPSCPAIIVGTVDMVGSRLLFEGYGVSRKMRPYHAGLLGADSLFVLDEAHLVPPFERLIEAAASAPERGLGPERDFASLIPHLQLLSLSATGRSNLDALGLGDADRAHPVVAQRIHARKVLELRAPAAKGELAKRLADEAYELATINDEPVRTIVFCDTRDDAGKVADDLSKRLVKFRRECRIELFVGGRRAFERAELASWLQGQGFIAGSASSTGNAILVATSAAEVGVDLDADAAVADVVAWERMVQRLGRVNRRGQRDAKVVLVPLAGDDRQPEQRNACLELIAQLPPCESGVDGSPAALVTLRARAAADADLADLVKRATTPAPLHPALDRAVVDAWAMTSLVTHTGRPTIQPWLRGWIDEDEPQTTVVFRAHLPLVDGKPFEAKTWAAYQEAAGPHTAERLEAEVWRVLEWLGKRLEATRAASDRPTGDSPLALAVSATDEVRVITRQFARDRRERDRLERMLAGGTLWVDAGLGGLERGLLAPQAEVPQEQSLDLTQVEGALPFRVRRVDELTDAQVGNYRLEKSFVSAHDSDGLASAWLLVERPSSELAVTEAGRSVARRAQGLAEHQSWAEEEARGIARRLGLDAGLTRALCVAARLHDEGKQADRWQRAFHVAVQDRPLAKSTRAPTVSLLGGYRHELGSLPRMERDDGFMALESDLRDLALHLVAAHHGRARPLLPTEGAEEPPGRLRQRACEVALRFDRLSRRYGPWGLAWLESLLRSADQRASKRNEESNG